MVLKLITASFILVIIGLKLVSPSGHEKFRIFSEEDLSVEICLSQNHTTFAGHKCLIPVVHLQTKKNNTVEHHLNLPSDITLKEYISFNIFDSNAAKSLSYVVLKRRSDARMFQEVDIYPNGHYVNIKYDIECKKYYYGNSCTTYCNALENEDEECVADPTDESCNHYECYADGKKTCAQGWEGYYGACDINTEARFARYSRNLMIFRWFCTIIGSLISLAFVSFCLYHKCFCCCLFCFRIRCIKRNKDDEIEEGVGVAYQPHQPLALPTAPPLEPIRPRVAATAPPASPTPGAGTSDLIAPPTRPIYRRTITSQSGQQYTVYSDGRFVENPEETPILNPSLRIHPGPSVPSAPPKEPAGVPPPRDQPLSRYHSRESLTVDPVTGTIKRTLNSVD